MGKYAAIHLTTGNVRLSKRVCLYKDFKGLQRPEKTKTREHADQFDVPHDPLELLYVLVLVHGVHGGHGVHGLHPKQL
jgi:hypothetical protein